MNTREGEERAELLAGMQVRLAAAGLSAEAQAQIGARLAELSTATLREIAHEVAMYGATAEAGAEYWLGGNRIRGSRAEDRMRRELDTYPD